MTDASGDTISISAAELADLKARLEVAETHRVGLLEHARNLEGMVKEKDDDLAQHRAQLKILEARCYRYEQLLQDYGFNPRGDEAEGA